MVEADKYIIHTNHFDTQHQKKAQSLQFLEGIETKRMEDFTPIYYYVRIPCTLSDFRFGQLTITVKSCSRIMNIASHYNDAICYRFLCNHSPNIFPLFPLLTFQSIALHDEYSQMVSFH